MTSATSRLRSRHAGLLRRFAKSGRGATAVEFAIVAMPFLFLVFAVFEISLIFLVNVTLETAVITASRQIRTGQNLTVNGISNTSSVNTFRQLVCSYMSWQASTCSAGVTAASSSSATTDSLVVDIRDPASFTSATQTSGVNSSNQLRQFDGTKSFCSGVAGSVVVVRVFYPWTVITPFLAPRFPNDSNGNVVLQSASTFKNEPYGTSSSTC